MVNIPIPNCELLVYFMVWQCKYCGCEIQAILNKARISLISHTMQNATTNVNYTAFAFINTVYNYLYIKYLYILCIAKRKGAAWVASYLY